MGRISSLPPARDYSLPSGKVKRGSAPRQGRSLVGRSRPSPPNGVKLGGLAYPQTRQPPRPNGPGRRPILSCTAVGGRYITAARAPLVFRQGRFGRFLAVPRVYRGRLALEAWRLSHETACAGTRIGP